MKRLLLAPLAALLFAFEASAQEAPPPPVAPIPPQVQRNIERLQAAALRDNNGYDIVESLVTEIGPRIGGSPAEARARDWAVAMLRRQGFSNVRVEPFTMTTWDATVETAAVTSPVQQPLTIAALGGSPSTPSGGLEAQVLRFTTMAALEAAPNAAVRGRIVFIDEPMTRTQDATGYGAAVRKRGRCAQVAQGKGAVACLIRSVGTNVTRSAHQGGRAFQPAGVNLPAAALAPPDADALARLTMRGPVRVRINITSQQDTNAASGNVLAELRGRQRPNEIVLVAAHLDSWDLGQGAIDDGSGVAIIVAATRLIAQIPGRPRRTIRILLAGSEENSDRGGESYAELHGRETHILIGESDLGADRIWRARTRFGADALIYGRAMQNALAPLAILPGDNLASPGSDVEAMMRLGVPVIGLSQDASRYFDWHHTAEDTLDKIDREQLRQNIAAWATVLYLAAAMDWDFRTGARAPAPQAANDVRTSRPRAAGGYWAGSRALRRRP